MQQPRVLVRGAVILIISYFDHSFLPEFEVSLFKWVRVKRETISEVDTRCNLVVARNVACVPAVVFKYLRVF